MTEHSFSLIPFPQPNIPQITIRGTIARQENILTVHYSLTGTIEDILFPDRSVLPARKDELWTTTCFEFFLAIKDQPQYWEFNMSPSGDWNIYHMDAYRRVGFREETSIERFRFEARKEGDCFSIDTVTDLSPLIKNATPLEAGVTSIIQTRDGTEMYWALRHPKPEADFHLRESFLIQL